MEPCEQINGSNQEQKMYESFAVSDFYQILALSMALPTKELLKALKDGSYRRDGMSILEDLSCEKQVIGQLDRDFCALEKDMDTTDALLTLMGQEYTRLFSHPESPVIGIYETMFSGAKEKGATLFVSPEALDANRCYQEAGIQVVNKSHEPPDYLCTELEFMMYLYREKGRTLHEKDYERFIKTQQQIDFFEKTHIEKWIPTFFDRVKTESELLIYKLIAEMARCGLAKAMPFKNNEALS